MDYFLVVKPEGHRLRIYRDNQKGAVRIPSGHTVSVVVAGGEHWRLSGDTGQELPVMTTRGRAAEVRLTPAIRSGKVGTSATMHDGRKNHSVLMFSHWARPAFSPGPGGRPGDKHVAPPPAGPGKSGPAAPAPAPAPSAPKAGPGAKQPNKPQPAGPGSSRPGDPKDQYNEPPKKR